MFYLNYILKDSIATDRESQKAIGPHPCNITPWWVYALVFVTGVLQILLTVFVGLCAVALISS